MNNITYYTVTAVLIGTVVYVIYTVGMTFVDSLTKALGG